MAALLVETMIVTLSYTFGPKRYQMRIIIVWSESTASSSHKDSLHLQLLKKPWLYSEVAVKSE